MMYPAAIALLQARLSAIGAGALDAASGIWQPLDACSYIAEALFWLWIEAMRALVRIGAVSYVLEALAGLMLTILKVILLGLALLFIFMLLRRLFRKDDGLLILPFQVGGDLPGYSGAAISDLLAFHLERIKEIHRAVGSQPDGVPKRQQIEARPVEASGEGGEPRLMMAMASYAFDLPKAVLKGEALEYRLADGGSLGLAGVTLPLGPLLLLLRGLCPWGDRDTLEGSLQKYGSGVRLVAQFRRGSVDRQAHLFSREAMGEKEPESLVPRMVEEMAYQLALLLARGSKSEVRPEPKVPRSWKAFQHQTEALERINCYSITQNPADLDQAASRALLARRAEPGSRYAADLIEFLADAYLEINRFDEADLLYGDISEIKPAESAFGLGLVYLLQGRNDLALDAFDCSIALNPNVASFWYVKGLAFVALGRRDEALAAYEEAIRLNPDEASFWYVKGLALVALGRRDEALAAYEEAIRLIPDDASFWYVKGLAFVALGRRDEALAAYEEAIRLIPDDASFWYVKSMALLALGRCDEALTASEEAIRLNPDAASSWYIKGNALVPMNRHYEALAAYEEAIRLKPNASNFWYVKGLALLVLGRRDEALAAYEEAIRLNPNDAGDWYVKGLALVALSRYEEALAAYDRAIELKPDYASAWSNKGVVLGKLDRPEEAIEAYRKALEFRPDDANALGNLAGLLLSLGDAAGFEPLRRALALSEKDPALKPLRLECLFYLYAHTHEAPEREKSLQEIEALLADGVRSPGWDLSANVRRARGEHPDPEQLEELARRIAGGEDSGQG
ncbi:MAG: tetratricopeptide repeat protein [Methanotrichaceae archaeon]|nr:tetratricopeptide repeat protein [Methanotrichaceae archaeon]